MRITEALRLALQTVWSHKLRSFFTLLGIIVSVAFLIAVVAVIQGMNAFVKEKFADTAIGVNAFQARRVRSQIVFFDDEMWRRVAKRPRITDADARAVRAAIPGAAAIGITSGWPTP